ncbi:NUDIX domain-containing protein [Candidatus Saccharibacteria bacterium]|nr:MAG: NUDIX domain-containing protein [Candidatus Saccharibacteria bacterium]
MNIEISLEHAKPQYLHYVTANTALVDPSDKTCLLIQRSTREKEAGGKWALPGGKNEHAIIQQSRQRRLRNILQIVAEKELQEEVGLAFDIDMGEVIANGEFIRTDGIPVVYTTVAAPYRSGTVTPYADDIAAYAWATEADIRTGSYDLVGDVATEVCKAIRVVCALSPNP